MTPSPCPTHDDLCEFAVGNLPRRRFELVAQHVEQCPACSATLQALDDTRDPLLHQLRSSLPAEAAPETPEELVAVSRSARRLASAEPPKQLGRFELLEELGAGSFGHVFRAHDPELDRSVAIKILRAGRLAGREEIDRFLREARSAAQLSHPGIVALFESGQTEDGTCYIVEEFLQGQTLAARINASAMEFRTTAGLVADVADALEYAHQRGVIHRDLKPSNIMLDPDGRPHLMDFGLAKREADETPVTLEGEVLGTPAYMSPEQARGESHHVDARSDIYSLGVILYELLTGERPFQGNRRMLLLQVLQDEPRPPRALNDRVPRDLETICLKALAKTPSRRYATAAELAGDLRRYLSGEPIRARPIGLGEQLWRWCRRNPVAAGLLVAVSLGSAFGIWHLSYLSGRFVQTTALTSAAQQAELFETFNDHYSDVVDVVMAKGKGVQVTNEYEGKPAAIPFPATLTIRIGNDLTAHSKSGVRLRLYSDYPWKSRTDGGPKDEFERQALARLREDPDQPYYSFEEYQGVPVLRYAVARRMRQSCVDCHKGHQLSPRRDWKVGDVRGVLEIIRPLDQDIARTRQQLRVSYILMAAISGALVGLTALTRLRFSAFAQALEEKLFLIAEFCLHFSAPHAIPSVPSRSCARRMPRRGPEAVAVFPKARLGLELLEVREAPAVIYLPPPPVLIAPPQAPIAPAPIRPSLSAPLPATPATDVSSTRSTLSGIVLGNYTSTLKLLNTASGFHMSGNAKVGDLGSVDVYAHLYSVGFKTKGNARGEITLSNKKGQIVLQVTGPQQTRLAALPDVFSYRVVSATGSFKNVKAAGTLKLTRKLDASPVRNGIRYVETGSFKLTL